MSKKLGENKYITRAFEMNGLDDVTAVEEDGQIKGHGAVFDQKVSIGGYFYETIERGAFDECDLSDVMLYINHGTQTIPLARSRGTKPTMSLVVDNKGLCVEAKLDIENNNEARAVYSSLKRKDLDGMSFAFKIKEQRWENLDTKMPTRVITKFSKVYEVSIVDRPAYSNAEVSARSVEPVRAVDELTEARNTLTNNSNLLELEKLKIKIKNM